MGYGKVWEVLSEMLKELRSKGETIPVEIMDDLRSAKTLIEILKIDPESSERIPMIEACLENVESYLFFEAKEKLGVDYVKKYMEKLEAARFTKEESSRPPRFFTRIPGKERWIRIQVSKVMNQAELEKFARENKLSLRMQKNGYMLVYGDDERIKSFVKRIAQEMHTQT